MALAIGFLSLFPARTHDTGMWLSGSLAVLPVLRLLGVLAAGAPGKAPATEPGNEPAATPPPIDTYGTIRGLTEKHDVGPKVTLRDLQKSSNIYGLGSLSDLRGEITFLDSVAWLAYPPTAQTGGTLRVVSSLESPETAGFLAVGHMPPGVWHSVGLDLPLTSEQLQATLEGLLPPARKKKSARPFLFRVEGHFKTVTLSVVDGSHLPPDAKGEAAIDKTNALQALREVDGTLVGLYSPKDGAAFNHAKKRMHVHVVLPKNQATGHMQTFVMAPGGSIWFP